MKCINCHSQNLRKIFSLGEQPISSIFYKTKKLKLKKYPLILYECGKCKLVQFSQKTPVNEMYGTNYAYKTALSSDMIKHLYEKYKKLNKRLKKKRCYVADIGSNDGTFLNFFSKRKNTELFGIDPSARVFKNNYKKNINIIDNFFSKKNLISYLNKKKKKREKFDLITSFAMFYDLEKPNQFCSDINEILDENGIWVSEFSYFPLLLKNLTYDQICHEHVAYYTLNTFKNCIDKNNLKIIDCSINEINGGSIEVICAKKSSMFQPKFNKISKLLKKEKEINLKAYKRFNSRVKSTRSSISNFLKKNKNKVIGYGASTKGNIVLNYCNINYKNLPLICDANKYKINRFTPGSNIKIISKNKMRQINPEYLFVLIWPFRSEVIKEEIKYIKNGGKLVFNLPRFHIVDKLNYKKYLKKKIKSDSYDL